MSIKETVKGYLVEKQNRRYRSAYAKEKKLACYDTAIRLAEEKEKLLWKKQIAGSNMPVCRILSQDFGQPFSLTEKEVDEDEIVLLVHSKGRLSDDALFYVETWFSLYPDTWMLYGDEDSQDEDGSRKEPWFKPAWSPDLFLSCFYLGAVIAIQGKQWNAILEQQTKNQTSVYELCHKLVEAAGGFQKGIPNLRIGHVDAVLFHHLATNREQLTYHIVKPTQVTEQPSVISDLVSIIIPSKDQPDILERNLCSLKKTIADISYEIILVDNGSTEENRSIIETMLQELKAENIQCKYLYHTMPFHFSKMCNLGAEEADGEILLFLNDDIEAIQPGWLYRMAERAKRNYVGAVGAKLLYPDSERIQHAGIVNLPSGPIHKLQFLDDSTEHFFGRNRMEVNVSAVTGACLMIRKELFLDCGGFAPDLPVAFNDVDLCFTLLEKGYYNVVMNSISLYHHESLSRGADGTREKLERLKEEQEILYKRHEAFRGMDPYYHKWLNQKIVDTGVEPVLVEEHPTRLKMTRKSLTKKIRLHPGVYLRVESIEGRKLQGIALILGDNNACYERKIVFAPILQEGEEDRLSKLIYEANSEEAVSYPDRTFYLAKLPRKLRMDIERNMPDQSHVGLSGFLADISELPPGKYMIGAALINKVTHVIYLNWSSGHWIIK